MVVQNIVQYGLSSAIRRFDLLNFGKQIQNINIGVNVNVNTGDYDDLHRTSERNKIQLIIKNFKKKRKKKKRIIVKH